MLEYFLGQAGTVIAHLDDYLVAVFPGRQLKDCFGLPGDGVEAIAQQVHQHLLESPGFSDQPQRAVHRRDVDAGRRFATTWLDDHQGVFDGADHQHRLWRRRILARKDLELADDAAGTIDEFADHLQVLGDLAVSPARQQCAGVVGEGLQRGQWLVQFVADAGRHLAKDGELAGLHGGVTRFAQNGLGAFKGSDLRREVERTFGNASFEFGIHAAQLLAAPGTMAEVSGQAKSESGAEGNGKGGAQCSATRLARIAKLHDMPAQLAHRTRGDQIFARSAFGQSQADEYVTGDRNCLPCQWCEGVTSVLARIAQPCCDRVGERCQGTVTQTDLGRQKGNAVGIGQQQGVASPGHGLLDTLEADLDGDDAQHLILSPDWRGEEVARFAGGDADRVEAPETILQRVEKIWTKSVVVTDKAAWQAPVAGSQRFPAVVHQVGHSHLGTLPGGLQVGVGSGDALTIVGFPQQPGQRGIEGQQTGQ